MVVRAPQRGCMFHPSTISRPAPHPVPAKRSSPTPGTRLGQLRAEAPGGALEIRAGPGVIALLWIWTLGFDADPQPASATVALRVQVRASTPIEWTLEAIIAPT